MSTISEANLKFLKELERNNNREWFNANRDRYESSLENAIDFADALLAGLRKIDDISTVSGKKSLQRMYRDIRFSKDKRPYKGYWGGGFTRATAARRGGYYFRVKPGGESVAAGGFWMPNKSDLRLIRNQIDADAEPLRKVLKSRTFRQTFGELEGEQLKTAPKGFPRDHPNIDLLRYKSFIIKTNFSDKEVVADDFPKKVVGAFKKMQPFLDCMTEYLTTDLNGVRLV